MGGLDHPKLSNFHCYFIYNKKLEACVAKVHYSEWWLVKPINLAWISYIFQTTKYLKNNEKIIRIHWICTEIYLTSFSFQSKKKKQKRKTIKILYWKKRHNNNQKRFFFNNSFSIKVYIFLNICYSKFTWKIGLYR